MSFKHKRVSRNAIFLALSTGLLIFVLFGRESIKQGVNSLFSEADYVEPDVYYQAALGNLNSGNRQKAIKNIDSAIEYIESLRFEEDSVNGSLLDEAIDELDVLQTAMKDELFNDQEFMRMNFVETDRAIAEYHLAIIEDFYWNEAESPKGLEKLYRVLVRLHESLDYMPNNDLHKALEIQKIEEEILSSEKLSPGLQKKVVQLLKTVHREN